MTPDEFRDAGHQLIDWIADYRATIEDRPVRADVEPGSIRGAMSRTPPATLSTIEELIADLDTVVAPGVLATQHPMHFGWFPSNAALASVLGDLASSGLGALGLSWESAPALTEVEEVVCDWMRQLTGMSDAWSGTIVDTASTGGLVAMLVARERATGHVLRRGGLAEIDRPLVVYTTQQAHSMVAKAALLAGFGADHLKMVATNPQTFAMDPMSLRTAMEEDLSAGRVPAAVVATVGSTAVTSIDPVADVAAVAAEFGAWVHVDAAMAGSAMLLPECRWMWDGIEKADSVSWNPHKWMGTVLDCSLLYVRDVDALTSVMATNPSYLRSGADGSVTQYRDWGIPLGRRFRALKLWFHLRLDGVESIRTRLRRDLANAQWLAGEVRAAPDWEVVAPVNLQTVCVRHVPEGMPDAQVDEHTQRWVATLNRSGDAYLSTATLGDRWMVRVSIGVESTEVAHVAALWDRMRSVASAAPSAEPLG